MEEERTQNALHLKEQMEELRKEVELEQTIDREKNQSLLLPYQRDSTERQLKVKVYRLEEVRVDEMGQIILIAENMTAVLYLDF